MTVHPRVAGTVGPRFTLAMDASTGAGTLALLRDQVVVAERDVVMRSEQEERFFPAVLDILSAAGLTIADLSQLVVGAGPGSFTALRVVAAAAKGMAQASGLPVWAVPSLALIVAADPSTADAPTSAGSPGRRYLATLDALRGERYAALVELNAEGDVHRVTQCGLIAVSDLSARAAELGATLIGPDETYTAGPRARGVARCTALLAASGPVHLPSWEPLYGRLAEAQVKWEAAHGRTLG